MGFLRKISKTFQLIDDPDVIKVLIKVSENGPIRTLDLQRKSGITKDTKYYCIAPKGFEYMRTFEKLEGLFD